MSDPRKQIADLFAREKLVKPRQKLLAGVSGGLDSMVLLQLLHELSAAGGWRLGVAHVNHGLRGRASGVDERFVRRAAEKLDCPFFTEKHDVRAIAAAEGISLEMAARKARHDSFSRAAKSWRCRKLALAHHLDDQAELFFLRLFRGAGAGGLGGMTLKSPFPGDSRITVLRPLLEFDRAELSAFASENRIRFRDDASNRDEDILRNRVRHRLLPALERDFQPAIKRVVVRSMELLRDSEALADEAVRLGGGEELSQAVQRRVMRGELIRLGIEPEFDLVERLLNSPGRRVSGPDGVSLQIDRAGKVQLIEAPIDFQEGERAVPVASGKGGYDGLSYRARMLKRRPRGNRGDMEHFDADRLGTVVRLRHWRAGDRFRPIGMSQSVKLQDLFVNAKIPRDDRRRLVVMERGNGEIVWVEGLRIGELAKIRPDSRRFWRWEWERAGR